MKTRLLSLTLALVMVLSALPAVLLPSLATEAPSTQTALDSTDDGAQTLDPYAALYVQDNLIFRWDAFDSVESSGASNLTLTDRDGRTGSITLSNATKHNGYVSSKGNIDFSALVPKDGADYADFSFDASIVQISDVKGWAALNLGTLPLTAGTGGSKVPFESYGNFYGTYQRYLTNKTKTVTYYFSEDGALLAEKPADGSYKTVNVPYLTKEVGQAAFGEDWSPRFYGNYKNESYSIGATLDYTQTDGYGTIKLVLYRDMKNVRTIGDMVYARGYTSTTKNTPYSDYVEIVPAASNGKTAYEVALQMAARSPAANGTYTGATDSGIFSFGGATSSSQTDVGYYAFRLYGDILTADEYLQNHFADLCAFHKVDNVSLFLSLSESGKKALYNQFADADVTKGNVDVYNTSYEDVTKDMLDSAILDAYATEEGLFDRSYITFDGYQASLYSSVGIRARYSLSKQALAQLPVGMTLAEIGVLSASATDFSIDDLTVAKGADGTFASPVGVHQAVVQKNGVNMGGVIEDTADALVFADTYLYSDTSSLDEDVFSERIYRAYAVFESNGSPIVVYTDAIGENEAFKNGISLYEISTALCVFDEKYIQNSAIKTVLLTVMDNLDQLQDTFDASYEELLAVRNGAIGEGTTFAFRVAEVESLLASTKDIRNKTFTEADSATRAAYLQTAGNALSKLGTYTSDMLSFKKNDAQKTADELLIIVERMKNEYENLRSFSTAMKLENTDELFRGMQAKIEESEILYRTFLPEVKETYDHFAAVKSVLNTFWNEINGAKGDGSGVTQIFLFGASTTTTASYPTTTHFPFQGMGYEFDEYFDDSIRVVNPSLAGWSLKALTGSAFITKTNIEELFAPENSPWAKMLMQLNPGDYVIFGSTCTNEKWQTGGDVYYVENADGTYSIVDQNTPGAKFYSVKQSEAAYQQMLVECFKTLIDMGVTPIIHTSTGNIGLSTTNANANDTSRFTGGTRSYEDVKLLAVNEVNAYYQAKNGNTKGYAYHADTAERCRETYLRDMQNGLTFNQVLDRYNQTQGAIEEFYATYGYVGSKYEKYVLTDEKMSVDYVHQNIRGALLVSSYTLKELQGTDIPLLDHIVTYELDEVELICNTLKEGGFSYKDPRK